MNEVSQPAVQAFSSSARIFLLAKAPSRNSKREEEMGRVRGSQAGAGREKGKRKHCENEKLPLACRQLTGLFL